ncbi:hypothetical protein D3C77_448430 [compost metagenome]
MSLQRIIRQGTKLFALPSTCGILKGADTDMTSCHTSQYCADLLRLAHDRLTRRHHRKAACRRNAKRVHRFADNILAQHWPKHRAAIAATRIRRSARAFKLDIDPFALRCYLFSKQYGPSIAQHGEMAELMTRIRLG